jgi:hypothetical protein
LDRHSSYHPAIDTGDDSAGDGGGGFFTGQMINSPVALFNPVKIKRTLSLPAPLPFLVNIGVTRFRPRHHKKAGSMIRPFVCSDLRAPHAAFIGPTFFSASRTFGRAVGAPGQ